MLPAQSAAASNPRRVLSALFALVGRLSVTGGEDRGGMVGEQQPPAVRGASEDVSRFRSTAGESGRVLALAARQIGEHVLRARHHGQVAGDHDANIRDEELKV